MLIKNGLIIHSIGECQEDIRITGEQFTEVKPNLTPEKDEVVLDAKGKWIFPGIIDPHTHMGIPIKNQLSADNFDTGTRSALNGGVTTIIDFTVLENNQSLKESIIIRNNLAEESHCDYGLHCNFTRFTQDLLDEIPSIINEGIISFKVFTTYKDAGMMLTYGEIEEVAKKISSENGLLMVHAEDDDEILIASKHIPEEEFSNPYSHGLSRPDTSEEKAILEMIKIAHKTKCSVYVVHLNSAKGFRAARSSDKIMIETCPHYLLLNDMVYKRKDGNMFVASPPLRKTDDAEILWRAISNNQIHTIGTDHCPFCINQKQTGIPFNQILNGMGGVETLFPILIAQWIKRDLPKPLLTKLVSTQPANIFGLQSKGEIKSGKDADLVIVSPNDLTDNWQDRLVSVTDWNGYLDFPALFPDHVILRGIPVVKKGKLQSLPKGKFIPGNI
ncbi:MAG: amidohydrolase family protein [Candidatus Marinimicrobia bacterium]|nr:amidohydrolase family protein [Candidatus Neomarinimicrobiota bacterium]